mmetsp:Transcript_23878/g.65590  ORF Transcript_23878/g.65590 Transcript_23878/m.65590 type:complete len:201 (-) Transcript_23878:406-1008(-)
MCSRARSRVRLRVRSWRAFKRRAVAWSIMWDLGCDSTASKYGAISHSWSSSCAEPFLTCVAHASSSACSVALYLGSSTCPSSATSLGAMNTSLSSTIPCVGCLECTFSASVPPPPPGLTGTPEAAAAACGCKMGSKPKLVTRGSWMGGCWARTRELRTTSCALAFSWYTVRRPRAPDSCTCSPSTVPASFSSFWPCSTKP